MADNAFGGRTRYGFDVIGVIAKPLACLDFDTRGKAEKARARLAEVVAEALLIESRCSCGDDEGSGLKRPSCREQHCRSRQQHGPEVKKRWIFKQAFVSRAFEEGKSPTRRKRPAGLSCSGWTFSATHAFYSDLFDCK
jgi:hypothetical protein